MSTKEQLITIAIMGLAVVATRFLPFVLFPSKTRTPRFVQYLSKYLASSVFGMLVIYCVKDTDFQHATNVIPELMGIISCVVLHLWLKNLLITMVGGTIVYMLIVQNI